MHVRKSGGYPCIRRYRIRTVHHPIPSCSNVADKSPFENLDSYSFIEKNYLQIVQSPQLHFLWSLICKIPPKNFPQNCSVQAETLKRYFQESLWEKQMRRLISLENNECQDEIWEFEIDWHILKEMLACFSIKLEDCTVVPLPLLMIRRFIATDYHLENNSGIMTHRTVNNHLAALLTLFPCRRLDQTVVTNLWEKLNDVFDSGDSYTASSLDEAIKNQQRKVNELSTAFTRINTSQIDAVESSMSLSDDGLLGSYISNYPVFAMLTPPSDNENQTVKYKIVLRRYQNENNIKGKKPSVRRHFSKRLGKILLGAQPVAYKMPWIRQSAFLEVLLPVGCRGIDIRYEYAGKSGLSKILQNAHRPINRDGRTIFASLRLDQEIIKEKLNETCISEYTVSDFEEPETDHIELHFSILPDLRILFPFWSFVVFQIAFLLSFWNLSFPEDTSIDTFYALAVPLLGSSLIFAALTEHHTLTKLLNFDRIVCTIMFIFDLFLFMQKTESCCSWHNYPYNYINPIFIGDSMNYGWIPFSTIVITWICILLLIILLIRLALRACALLLKKSIHVE